MEKQTYHYGIRLAVIYSLVWFIDLLDASSLNIALPAIANFFQVSPLAAEWAIVGFLFSMTLGISISGWLGDTYGTKSIFLLSQGLYLGSSLGCGLSPSLSALIFFRCLQGFAGGMAIPLGMAALLKALPEKSWAKTMAAMNMVTLIAPALGPLFGAYMTQKLGWEWIFFFKLPLSAIGFVLSILWIRSVDRKEKTPFDSKGFILGGISLVGLLWVFSEAGKGSTVLLLSILIISLIAGILFIRVENKSSAPLIPLAIFKFKHFTYGNLIQSAANTIFLGANFLIAYYLQKGLGWDLITTGWVMAAITPGMIVVQPLVGKFYNQLGPLPYLLVGLSFLALSTLAFTLTNVHTSPYILASLVFCIGAASSLAQSANVSAIFSSLPHTYKGAGSTLYALFKQISASFGVALTTMILSVGTLTGPLSPALFHICFLVLGFIPLLALLLCSQINNQASLNEIKK